MIFKLEDTVMLKDGGVTGEIVFISGGKALVRFDKFSKELELQHLVLMGRKNR